MVSSPSEVERASWLFLRPNRNTVSIDHGGLKACVSEECLDDATSDEAVIGYSGDERIQVSATASGGTGT